MAPPRRAGSRHRGDTAGTRLAPKGRGGTLTLPGLLLPCQCAAQLAQERLVLLHLGGPRGGRSWWRGGHMRVRATHRRPGSGQEGAAAASPPLPTDPEVSMLQLSSPPAIQRDPERSARHDRPPFVQPHRAGSPESISPTNMYGQMLSLCQNPGAELGHHLS